jgi:hypothetical protein
MSEEDFVESFIGMHQMGSAITGVKAIALPNSHVSQDMGEDFAKLLYKRILAVPMLHFMLDPRATWLGDIMIAVAYMRGMQNAVREEIGHKSQPKKASTKDEAKTMKSDSVWQPSPEQSAGLGA